MCDKRHWVKLVPYMSQQKIEYIEKNKQKSRGEIELDYLKKKKLH